MIYQEPAIVHQANCTGVTNLMLITTNHGRQLRGAPFIGYSLTVGVSAPMSKISLSSWSGAWRWWSVCLLGGRSGWGVSQPRYYCWRFIAYNKAELEDFRCTSEKLQVVPAAFHHPQPDLEPHYTCQPPMPRAAQAAAKLLSAATSAKTTG
ncbi:hypothetical protein ACFQHW_01900 [Lapidilactobacillus achengensis]|uniref:Uncharacterized protein n=1 Tax=Lapidilactobacillus achengensis TaxID=2486000 RepID=A0ABW1UMN3_9LACO|nr:hypothetical protein [Lapidilactobacillus achengensis]